MTTDEKTKLRNMRERDKGTYGTPVLYWLTGIAAILTLVGVIVVFGVIL